ncbi:MAG: hypothetical protein WBZ11_07855 [Candidatus Sulfotelmatobacter sp.]
MRRFLTFLALLASTAAAQWLNYPTPGLRRTKDGKPDLTAKTPRTRDGKPDLSGVWHVQGESDSEKRRIFGNVVDRPVGAGMEFSTVSKYLINIVVDYKPGEIVLTPAAQAALRARPASAKRNDCLPVGMPEAVLGSEVHKIVQTPGLILMMLEADSLTRQIYTDGRKLPTDPAPSWLGYSVGHWEKNTLVVETIGFNGKTFLDGGHPISDRMHMTERYLRRDAGHMYVEMTFDDPQFYNKPFTAKVTHLLQPDTDILEYVCAENEKDRVHMK